MIHTHTHSQLQMVTSSELCTLITTQDNSFLVWGSRPVIKSPLVEILEQGEDDSAKLSRSQKCVSTDTMESTVFSDNPPSGPGTPNSRRTLPRTTAHTSNVSLSLPTSDPQRGTLGSQHLSSGEGSPTKASSNDSIARASSPSKNAASEPTLAFKTSTRLMGHCSRNPSLNFSEIPHTLVSCPTSSQYLSALSDVLVESLNVSSRGKTHQLKRESSSGAQLSVSHRRGTSTSSSSIHTLTSKEGVILQPTALDLVGNSGILSLLSVEGITEAKLEGLSCYGSNVLVLIQAQIVIGTCTGKGEGEGEKGSAGRNNNGTGHSNELPTFRIGRRLTQRTQWRSVYIFVIHYIRWKLVHSVYKCSSTL